MKSEEQPKISQSDITDYLKECRELKYIEEHSGDLWFDLIVDSLELKVKLEKEFALHQEMRTECFCTFCNIYRNNIK